MSDLKPCPFCGGDIVNHRRDCYFVVVEDARKYPPAAFVDCGGPEAIEDAWNRRASPWIPVSEREIPDDGGTYLVANNLGQVAPIIRGVIQNNTGSKHDFAWGSDPIRWMPLPEPPCDPGGESNADD